MIRILLRGAAVLGLAMVAIAAQASTITYFHNNLVGSPVAATNQSGQVIWRESYRPYGERLTNSAASKDNSVWFTSRRQDAETGLVYMGARYYDPVMGRFISTDPKIFDEANLHSFNRYAYANDNPYKYADPDGKSPWLVAALAGYGGGVLADAAGQYAAWGSVDWTMAMSSSAALSGAQAGLMIPGASLGLTIERVGAEAISEGLTDSALVCRGGSCTADRFVQGKGVTIDAAGKMDGVSVNSANGKSLEDLTTNIPKKQVGRTTVGEVRKAGGDVTPSPTANNSEHCTMCGISAERAESLFSPTVRNPNAQ